MSFKLKATNCTDSYKTSHHKMISDKTDIIYSNFTPRSDRLFVDTLGEARQFYKGGVTVYGVQAALGDIVEIWDESFFMQECETVCAEYARRLAPFAGGMEVTVDHFRDLWHYGSLPVVIRSLDEGTTVPMGVPLLTIHNIEHEDARFGWLTNYLETWLSNELWHPMTVATIASVYRNLLDHYAEKTGSPMEFVDWQGHDFACRGMSNMVAAAKALSGHLVYFRGTDTLSAVDYIEWAYSGKDTFVGGSVPASEHMVMTLEGEVGELELFRKLITTTVPTGVVSLVSDGFDYWKVITEYSAILKGEILARKTDALGLAKVVFRPDSGDPVEILCGLKSYKITGDKWDDIDELGFGSRYDVIEIDGKYFKYEMDIDRYDDVAIDYTIGEEVPEHVVKGSVEVLWDIFGGTITPTGHKLLDSKVGLIYGDSITLDRAARILKRLDEKGFASANVVFGIGSYTYQHVTRDTFGFAMKCTWAKVDGEGRDIYKDPKTGNGVKKSARGLLNVEEQGGKLVLTKLDEAKFVHDDHGELKLRYDGESDVFYNITNIDEIRVRAQK